MSLEIFSDYVCLKDYFENNLKKIYKLSWSHSRVKVRVRVETDNKEALMGWGADAPAQASSQ